MTTQAGLRPIGVFDSGVGSLSMLQPCDGLAYAIEQESAIKTGASFAHYTGAKGRFGLNPGNIDALLLGCTHYPFATGVLQTLVIE